MKHSKLTALTTLLVLGTGVAAAQSLGDYARHARKNKTEPAAASRHYDNDNLPTNDQLSVVGPAPAITSAGANGVAPDPVKPPVDPAVAAAEKQKSEDELKKKIDLQRSKLESLNKELDLDQREYRLRAAAMYADAGNRLRNQAQWDKDDAHYRSDIEGKQKTIDAAKQELDSLQEEARKAGIREKEQDDSAKK